jgi:PTH1 family peptidyl-tRNA hydrolase
LRSLIERLGHNRFGRLRVGILTGEPIDDLADYVLKKQPPAVRRQLAEMAGIAADAAEGWLREGLTATADRYNGLRRFDEKG